MKSTARFLVLQLFFWDTMPFVFGAIQFREMWGCACYSRYLWRCFSIFSHPTHDVAMIGVSVYVCFRVCAGKRQVFLLKPFLHFLLFILLTGMCAPSLPLLRLSSALAPIPTPPLTPVSLQSLLCNLSASHSPDPALPCSELKPDRCSGLMF